MSEAEWSQTTMMDDAKFSPARRLQQAPSAPSLIDNVDPEAFPQAAAQREVKTFIWDSTKTDISTLLRGWMGASVVQKCRIWDITIPGSHNSATYEITHKESNRAVLKFVSQFVKCQELNIYDQLTSGIRFLDLRVCKHPLQPGVPYCAHGGYRVASLLEVLRQIARFLDENQSEIVIVSTKRDQGYQKGEGSLSLLETDFWISLYLGRFLGPKLRSGTTVGEMVHRGQQLVYFYNEVERYLPNERDMFVSRFETHKSVDFRAMDSVLNAPTIPRKVRVPEDFEDGLKTPQRRNPLKLLGEMTLSPVSSLVPSLISSPISGSQSPAMTPLNDNSRELRTPHRLSKSAEPAAREAESSSVFSATPKTDGPATDKPEKLKTSPKTKNSLTPEQILEFETRFITRCIDECLPTLEDIGNQALRRCISEQVLETPGDGNFYELAWRGGIVQYAASQEPTIKIKQARGIKTSEVEKPRASREIFNNETFESEVTHEDVLPASPRFHLMPPSTVLKLGHEDAQRFRQFGLKKEFFIHPLKGKVGGNFMFASPYKTGRTLIEKSWAQTRECNAAFLMPKLQYWTAMHGKKIPRPPYRFRILASEVTPPNADAPHPGTETMRFWAQQSAASLLFLPSGLRPYADAANKLLADLMSKELVSRLNGITHDFVVPKIVLTILFLQLKVLAEQDTPQVASALRAARSPEMPGQKSEQQRRKDARGELATIIMQPAGPDPVKSSQTQLKAKRLVEDVLVNQEDLRKMKESEACSE